MESNSNTNLTHPKLLRAAAYVLIVGLLVTLFASSWKLALALLLSMMALSVSARDFQERILVMVLAGAWMLSVQFEILRFQLSEQVLFLLGWDTDPLSLLTQMDLWGPRYLITYPAIWIANHWNMSLDQGFTLYGGALLTLEVYVLVKIFDACLPNRQLPPFHKILQGVVFILLIFGVGMLMNGRLVAAHLGMALILWGQVNARVRGVFGLDTLFFQIAGLFLSMMSSGTMMVALGQVLVAPFLLRKSKWSHPVSKYAVFGLGAVSLAAAVPIIKKGIEKNLDFFGGGLSAIPQMLEHGLGQWLREDPLLAFLLTGIMLTGSLLFLMAGSKLLSANFRLSPLVINLPIAILCGLFGYSTLSMGLPALLLLMSLLAYPIFVLKPTPHENLSFQI